MSQFKNFFTYFDDENIERISNKLENQFQKTFPKTIKRIMKIKKGAMSRINIRKEILNQIKAFGTQPPQFLDRAILGLFFLKKMGVKKLINERTEYKYQIKSDNI